MRAPSHHQHCQRCRCCRAPKLTVPKDFPGKLGVCLLNCSHSSVRRAPHVVVGCQITDADRSHFGIACQTADFLLRSAQLAIACQRPVLLLRVFHLGKVYQNANILTETDFSFGCGPPNAESIYQGRPFIRTWPCDLPTTIRHLDIGHLGMACQIGDILKEGVPSFGKGLPDILIEGVRSVGNGQPNCQHCY